MKVRSAQKQHSRKQKDTARKNGTRWLKKSEQLSRKADIICGGFYWEPTHLTWRVEFHVPEDEKPPEAMQTFIKQLQQQSPKRPFQRTRKSNSQFKMYSYASNFLASSVCLGLATILFYSN